MTPDDDASQAAFRAEARAWLGDHAHLAPVISGIPTEAEVDQWRAWSRTMAEGGYAGITWPIEAGGRSLPYSYLEIWLSEAARAGVPEHFGVIGVDMAGPTIIAWGNDEQQRRLLPPLLTADEIWCQGFSEPGSGSDLAAARTCAVLDGDEWVITGQKVWSSFAQYARWCILLARTDPTAPKHKGLSFFLVDMSLPGVDVRPLPQLTGDPEFNEIYFDNVRIPRSSMLGEPGDGWKVALTTLDYERSTHGVALSSQLIAELDRVGGLMTRPGADSNVPADDPILAERYARIWVRAQGLRVTNLRSLSELDQTGKPSSAGTISKLEWSLLNQALAALAQDVVGLDGLVPGADGLDGGHWAYTVLRTRGNSIEAGTSEVLRNIIAERVLRLPRAR
ncbi:acyl-CoA dehydrogenase [Rhodococcus sp. WS4]|nr:acyl-CoA dehydrogenase [Rhodococcus sp. WS4]